MFWRKTKDELSDREIKKRIRAFEKQLSDPEFSVRKSAAWGLFELTLEEKLRALDAMPLLLRCLRDPDKDIGSSAVAGLKYLAPESIGPLVICLSDTDTTVIARACESLGAIGESAAVALVPLRTLIEHPAASIKQSAIAALGVIGDTSSITIDVLLKIAEAGTTVERGIALRALARSAKILEDKASIVNRQPMILKSCFDADNVVRHAAACLLEGMSIDPNEHLSILVKLLEHEDDAWNRGVLARRIRDLPSTVDFNAYLLSRSCSEVAKGGEAAVAICELFAKLGRSARAAVPTLLEALNAEPSVAIKAAEALWAVARRFEESLPILAKHFDDYGEQVSDAICVIGPAAAPLLPKIIAALESNDWDLQWAASDALGEVASDDPTVIAALGRALAHDSPIVKSSAARGLAKIGKSAVPSLTAMLERREDNRSEWAADTLGQMGHIAIDAGDALRAGLQDSRAGVVAWSAIALAKIAGDPIAVPSLIELLETNDEPSTRSEAAFALGLIGPSAKGALRALRRASKELDEDVRDAANDAILAIEAKRN